MAYQVKKAYQRDETIILSLDIGTTHTAVSFSHAIPGERPDVRSVIKWPGQPEASGDSKIPTIIAYQDEEAKYFGAEAREFMDDEEYETARWFKLRLHPDSMRVDPGANGPGGLEIPALPRGVSLIQVYTDFIRYIYKATKTFFINNTPNGQQTWSQFERQIPIIFCTPNGWDISQYTVLADAAIQAGIVTQDDAEDRLWFLTEGEASVHYALAHTETIKWLNDGVVFAVTDVGGSTVDSTLYRCVSRTPLILEEVCASACVQAGGIFVDQTIRSILENRLEGSEYNDAETISMMTRQFEQKAKRAFDGSQRDSVIQFGSNKDNDTKYNIVKGKITLSNEEVQAAYLAVISSITSSCLNLLANRTAQHLLLVGGFGESPYLKERLKRMLNERGTEVVTLEEPSYVLFPGADRIFTQWNRKKAAAEGSVIWYLTELVDGRAARFDYGAVGTRRYNDDRGRYKDKVFRDISGAETIWVFQKMIPRDTIFNDQWKCTCKRHRRYSTPPNASDLGNFTTKIFVWRQKDPAPLILNRDDQSDVVLPPGLEELFSIEADLGALSGSLQQGLNQSAGEPYWTLYFSVDLVFKNMRLMARVRWDEKGVERVGPAKIIPVTRL